MRAVPIALATAAVLLLPRSAEAVPVTFAFEGVVEQVDDLGGVLDGSVVVSTPFAGSYSFDTEAPDSSSDPCCAVFEALSIEVEVGNYRFESSPTTPNISINFIRDIDRYVLNSNSNDGTGDFGPPPGQDYDQFLRIQMMLASVVDESLSPSPPQFSASFFEISAELSPISDPIFAIRGSIATLLPEPATGNQTIVGCLATALLVLARNASRRRAK